MREELALLIQKKNNTSAVETITQRPLTLIREG